MVAHFLDDRGVSFDGEDQPPPPGQREGVGALPIAGEGMQAQAGDVEELPEFADVTDGGDPAQVGPPDIAAPLAVGTGFLLGATLKAAGAESDVQGDSALS